MKTNSQQRQRPISRSDAVISVQLKVDADVKFADKRMDFHLFIERKTLEDVYLLCGMLP